MNGHVNLQLYAHNAAQAAAGSGPWIEGLLVVLVSVARRLGLHNAGSTKMDEIEAAMQKKILG